MTEFQPDAGYGEQTRDQIRGAVRQLVEDEHGYLRSVPADTATRKALQSNVVDASVSSSASTTEVAVLLSAPGEVNGFLDSYVPADATVNIHVGALDTSGIAPDGVGSETLSITVEQPDGTTEPFTKTTDSSGAAILSYDLANSGRGQGRYTVTVKDADNTSVSTSARMIVGENGVVTSVQRNEVAFTGQSTTFEVLVHDGETAVTGESVDLRVADNLGNTVTSVSTTTDSNGFATISWTPSSTGDYRIEARKNSRGIARKRVSVVDRLVRSGDVFQDAVIGRTNAYGGYVYTPSGTLSNTDIVVGIYEDFDYSTVVAEKTLTTDDQGFFVLEYDLPSDYSKDNLYAKVETTGGDRIPVTVKYIAANDTSDGGGSGSSSVELSTSTNKFTYAPGETVTVNIKATDSGSAIANETVEVFLRYGFGGPPVLSTSVTTDSNGTASASVSLPSSAPDGEQLTGTVAMDYEGSTYSDEVYARIRELQVRFDVPRLTPGNSESFGLDVTETDTGNAVQGHTLQFDAKYAGGRAGSYATAGLKSQSDGTDTTSVTVASDVGFETAVNMLSRYRGPRRFRLVPTDLPGSLSTTDTITAGGSTDFTFSVSASVTTYGVAFGQTPDDQPFAKRFTGLGTFSITLPEWMESGDTFDLTVWAIDGSGNLYSGHGEFTVDAEAFLSERWRTATGARVQYSRPATDGSQVFGANLGPEIAALSPADGSVNWSTSRAGALSDSSPAVASGTIYVGSGGGTLYALSASDGSQQWTVTTDSAIVSSPTVASSTVYVGANDGTVRAVDTSGTQQWATTLGGAVYSRPAVANGRVHVTTADGSLVTLDASDGSELWRLDTGVDLGHTGAIVDSGTVYLPADKLYALDASSGSQSWTASFGGPSGSTPTLVSSTLYVGSSDGAVYAVNSDGTTAWTTSLSGTIASTPAVASGRVAVGSTDGTLYVLDASDGSQLGSDALGAPTRASPLVLNDDIYIGLRNGEVVSLASLSG